MPDTLDAAAVRHWCVTGLDRLRRHQHEIDELNVYPVPDGDTGTNLVLTMTAACEAAHAEPPDALGATLRRVARGALLGARGNSGVILSQVFAGMADVLADVPAAGGPELARALDRAAAAARAAVAAPAEGTILTVARAAADAALAAAETGAPVDAALAAAADAARTGAAAAARTADLAAVAGAAADAARAALARTPEQLPALARAGVVDAGGRGLVVLLDALVEVVTGTAPPEADRPVVAAAPRRAALAALRETGSDEYGYEVQFLLDAVQDNVDRLRGVLRRLGDSLVVVGAQDPDSADRTWNVHVHVNDVGAALEAAVEAGRPHRISVTRFTDQQPAVPKGTAQPAPTSDSVLVDNPAQVRSWAGEGDGDHPEPAVARPRARAVVVVCDGDEMAELFAAEGAEVVRRHPDGAAPSTGEILDAVRATGAGRVVIMPNDPNVLAAASAAAGEARAARIRAGVVPTRSPVQALAALAVRDPGRRFEDDVIAMAEAAGGCRYAEVTTASREALTVAGRCQPGDVLALVQGEVGLIGQDLLDTCQRLLDRLLGAGGELVTLLSGDDAPPGLTDRLTEHVSRDWPFVEVTCYRGGQPHYPLLVGVE